MVDRMSLGLIGSSQSYGWTRLTQVVDQLKVAISVGLNISVGVETNVCIVGSIVELTDYNSDYSEDKSSSSSDSDKSSGSDDSGSSRDSTSTDETGSSASSPGSNGSAGTDETGSSASNPGSDGSAGTDDTGSRGSSPGSDGSPGTDDTDSSASSPNSDGSAGTDDTGSSASSPGSDGSAGTDDTGSSASSPSSDGSAGLDESGDTGGSRDSSSASEDSDDSTGSDDSDDTGDRRGSSSDSDDDSSPMPPPALPSQCYWSNASVCSWYAKCLTRRFPCSRHQCKYFIRYAAKFCGLYSMGASLGVSSISLQWIQAVRGCILAAYESLLYRCHRDPTDDEVQHVSVHAYDYCFMSPASGQSLCQLVFDDWSRIFWTVKASLTSSFASVVRTTLATSLRCGSAFTQETGNSFFSVTLQRQSGSEQDQMALDELAHAIVINISSQLHWSNATTIEWYAFAAKPSTVASGSVRVQVYSETAHTMHAAVLDTV